MAYRDNTKVIKIGDRVIGGGNPILIQSMTNVPTEDVEAVVAQIHRLEEAGCEIIRCTVPNEDAARAIAQIKKQISIPLVADIHFDYKMAIAAMNNGADKIRINPGNIGGREKLGEVVKVAKEYGVPIRVGVNSGSLEKELVAKYNGVTAQGIVESLNITEAEAKKIVEKRDSFRKLYFNKYTGREYTDLHNYSLTIDTGIIDYHKAIKMIARVIETV